MIALDTETSLISDQEPVPRLVSVALAWSDADVELLHQSDPATAQLVEGALAGPTAFCNAPFDLAVLIERYPDLWPHVWAALERDPAQRFRSPGDVLDVATRGRLLDLAHGRGLARYSLAVCSERWAGITLDKSDPWRLRYVELIDTPISQWPADAASYAGDDAMATFATADGQDIEARAFAKEHNLAIFGDAARQARAHWALHLSSLHGVCADPVAVAALDVKLERELQSCKALLIDLGLVRPTGVRDTKAAAAMVEGIERSGGGTANRTPTGGVSLDEESLAGLHLEDMDKARAAGRAPHPLAVYQRYGSILGLRSRVLAGLRSPVLRTRYNELQANGRTSSSNPNLQNLPRGDHAHEKGFRECLVPRPGRIFVQGDWAKMELCTIAQVLITLFGEDAPTSALARALREGRDPHTEVGMRFMPNDIKRGRQVAKPNNFGRWGAMGNERFSGYARAQGVIMTSDEIEASRVAWYQAWSPGPYFAWVAENALDGIVQFVSGRVRGGTSYTDACNGAWSGLAADIAKDTLWRLCKEIYGAPGAEGGDLYGCRQVLFVHDENVLEAPIAQAEKCAARLKTVMEQTFSEWCPDVPCRAEVRLLERYTK